MQPHDQAQAQMMQQYYNQLYGGQGGMQNAQQAQQMQAAMMQAQMQAQMQGGQMTPAQQMQQMAMMQQMALQQQQWNMQQGMQGMQQNPASAAAAAMQQQIAANMVASQMPANTQTAPAAAAPKPAESQSTVVAGSAPTLPEVRSVGIFLEEIAYFLEDMEHDLWWLLRLGHQPAGPPPIVRGDEQLSPIDPAVEEVIRRMTDKTNIHADAHANQVRAKIIMIPSVDKVERDVLAVLKKLKFHCKGCIEVFPCMKEANNNSIWQAYFSCVAAAEPQWMMKTDGVGGKELFARCALIVPVYIDRNKKEIKLFNIWCPEKKKRHWSFPAGDILLGTDRSIYDTCRRVFEQEVGVFFGRKWSDCFIANLPESGNAELKEPTACSFVQLEKDGHRYPSRPHFFLQVTEDFYESTRCYEDSNGVIKLPAPEGDFVRWDDVSSAKRMHLDGVFWQAHDEARWVGLEYETGKIIADDSRQLRKENAETLRMQPEKVWRWLADIAGLEAVVRESAVPADLPEDGPFSVRMSGIDKTATDDDIRDYFATRDVMPKSVEQFEVPRHTARIDFEDREALEQALQLSGHNLLRRKVKVELWTEYDASVNAAAPGAKPLVPYTGPLPEEGPFKVIIRGLDKTVNRRDLGYFFWDRDCQVKEVEFPIKSERHAGMVEFENQESLRNSLGLNGAVFKGREVNIAMPTKDDGKERGGNRGGGGGGKGGGKRDRGYERDRGDDDDRRGGRDRMDRAPPSRSEFGSERPKMNLAPRSRPLPGEPGYREEESRNSSIFGGGSNRDDRFKSTRADADDNWRR
eukprot:TRINITY_DN39902_c0_g1_i1.p1 TRINITY_DN39902_c0_g1~~TRINITY_DN39902_c0_g1_i1.p1  ORF type:complete len:802 (-),score=214.90 TRINITY_DN39902_c0_g1_i1:294-2699(-)